MVDAVDETVLAAVFVANVVTEVVAVEVIEVVAVEVIVEAPELVCVVVAVVD